MNEKVPVVPVARGHDESFFIYKRVVQGSHAMGILFLVQRVHELFQGLHVLMGNVVVRVFLQVLGGLFSGQEGLKKMHVNQGALFEGRKVWGKFGGEDFGHSGVAFEGGYVHGLSQGR